MLSTAAPNCPALTGRSPTSPLPEPAVSATGTWAPPAVSPVGDRRRGLLLPVPQPGGCSAWFPLKKQQTRNSLHSYRSPCTSRYIVTVLHHSKVWQAARLLHMKKKTVFSLKILEVCSNIFSRFALVVLSQLSSNAIRLVPCRVCTPPARGLTPKAQGATLLPLAPRGGGGGAGGSWGSVRRAGTGCWTADGHGRSGQCFGGEVVSNMGSAGRSRANFPRHFLASINTGLHPRAPAPILTRRPRLPAKPDSGAGVGSPAAPWPSLPSAPHASAAARTAPCGLPCLP